MGSLSLCGLSLSFCLEQARTFSCPLARREQRVALARKGCGELAGVQYSMEEKKERMKRGASGGGLVFFFIHPTCFALSSPSPDPGSSILSREGQSRRALQLMMDRGERENKRARRAFGAREAFLFFFSGETPSLLALLSTSTLVDTLLLLLLPRAFLSSLTKRTPSIDDDVNKKNLISPTPGPPGRRPGRAEGRRLLLPAGQV